LLEDPTPSGELLSPHLLVRLVLACRYCEGIPTGGHRLLVLLLAEELADAGRRGRVEGGRVRRRAWDLQRRVTPHREAGRPLQRRPVEPAVDRQRCSQHALKIFHGCDDLVVQLIDLCDAALHVALLLLARVGC